MRTALIIAAVAALTTSPAWAEPAIDCLLEVGGQAYVEGPCDVEPDEDGSFVLRGPNVEYFAYVTPGDMSYWNEEAGADHAHSPLGILQQDGTCWVDETAKVCYTPAK